MAVAENRRHQRYDALNLVSYFVFNEDGTPAKQGVGRTLNVSQGGIRLELRQSSCGPGSYRPLTGQTLTVALGLEDDMIEIEGRMMYVVEKSNDRIIAGVAFGPLEEEPLSVLKRYILSRNTIASDAALTSTESK